MKLNEKDAKRFYNIWFHLLDYTNENHKIVPELKNIAQADSINPESLSPIRKRLWEDNSILDEFVSKNPFQFSEADLSIVHSWKNHRADKFILLKHLKNYSVFMSSQNVYGVIGIVSPIAEMFPAFALPLMIDAVLLPFEGKIIYDSLVMTYPVNFGSGAKKGFQEEYRELKKKSGIITSL